MTSIDLGGRGRRRPDFWWRSVTDDLLHSAAHDAFASGDHVTATNILAALNKPGCHTAEALAELAAALQAAPDDATRGLVELHYWRLVRPSTGGE